MNSPNLSVWCIHHSLLGCDEFCNMVILIYRLDFILWILWPGYIGYDFQKIEDMSVYEINDKQYQYMLKRFKKLIRKRETSYRDCLTGIIDTDLYILSFLDIKSLNNLSFVNKEINYLVHSCKTYSNFKKCFDHPKKILFNLPIKDDKTKIFEQLFCQAIIYGNIEIIKYIYNKFWKNKMIYNVIIDSIFIKIIQDDMSNINFLIHKVTTQAINTCFTICCIKGKFKQTEYLSQYIKKNWQHNISSDDVYKYTKCYLPEVVSMEWILGKICLMENIEMIKWFYNHFIDAFNGQGILRVMKVCIKNIQFLNLDIFLYLFEIYKTMYSQPNIDKIFSFACYNNNYKIASYLQSLYPQKYVFKVQDEKISEYAIYKKVPKDTKFIVKQNGIIKYAFFETV